MFKESGWIWKGADYARSKWKMEIDIHKEQIPIYEVKTLRCRWRRRTTVIQPRATELSSNEPKEKLEEGVKWYKENENLLDKLTRATITQIAITFVFFHHICLLTLRAPLLNAVACPAMTSVLSTSSSILSPLLRICSTFCTMMSLTWFNSVWARVSSSTGGAVLYVWTRASIVGPNVPCKP